MKKNLDILDNRELNRVFSRTIQANMVDGYDIDGKNSESSWGHSHVVLIKSQRGKKDAFRVVELFDATSSFNQKLSYRKLFVTEYENVHDMDRKENGKVLSDRTFYVVGSPWGKNKAWTENADLAEKLFKLHRERQHLKFYPRGHELPLTGKTLEHLVVMVRNNGHLCKSIGPKNIVNASIGLNGNNEGPIRVNVTISRNGKTQDVQISAKKAIDYSNATPSHIARIEKREGNKANRERIIARLVRPSWI